MKVIFIVQGEGRGHLTQAITLERLLRRSGHEVTAVLVVSPRGDWRMPSDAMANLWLNEIDKLE